LEAVYSPMRSATDRQTWQRWAAFLYFLVDVLYLPLATQVLQVFGCVDLRTAQTTSERLYHLRAEPNLSCSGSDYAHIQGFAIFAVFAYVIGIPAFFFVRIFRERNRLDTTPVRHEIGFLWEPLKRETFFYYIVVLYGRRLLLAVFLTQIPFRSIYMPMAISFLLIASVILSIYVRPFAFPLDQLLDVILTLLALVTFLTSILAGVGQNFFQFSSLSDVLLVMNTIVKVGLVVLFIARFVHKKLTLKE